jgi:hypothetical protein
MPRQDVMEKASSVLKIVSGVVYLIFAIFFIIIAVELYTGNLYLTPTITFYIDIPHVPPASRSPPLIRRLVLL